VLSAWFEGVIQTFFTPTERAPPVRRRKADLRARVNGHLALRFTAAGLTSYGGLELFRRYLVTIGFAGRLRRRLAAASPGGDYSSVAMIQLVITMLVVGARRLRHRRLQLRPPDLVSGRDRRAGFGPADG